MPTFATLSDPKAYHIIAYGTLLGSSFYQAFVAGPVAYKAIPRSAFASLQTAVFPVFFALQTALPVALALTWPGRQLAAAGSAELRRNAGLLGLLQAENLYEGAIPIGIMFVTALANLAVLGPATTKMMRQRKHQETRDGKKSTDPGPHSDAMQKLNKQFGALHGVSVLFNLFGLIATVVYGFDLSERL